jgi:DNA-binding LytR/AlgR family response regulator
MKIKIEIQDDLIEDEVVIRCSKLNEDVQRIGQAVSEIINSSQKLTFFKGGKEFYLMLKDILFFETEEKKVNVHTKDDIYQSKYKLYELEEMLPGYFMRVSKSTILNTKEIYSISWNLTSTSVVGFTGTQKSVYVSRSYYKVLKNKLDEKKNQWR